MRMADGKIKKCSTETRPLEVTAYQMGSPAVIRIDVKRKGAGA